MFRLRSQVANNGMWYVKIETALKELEGSFFAKLSFKAAPGWTLKERWDIA